MIIQALAAAIALPVLAQAPSAPSKPNIVVVFIDDMGWADFSCFGNKDVKTPNIDALAAEGMRFEQFCVNAPICSPSRTALLTGQYPQRWRIDSYLASRKENENRGIADWLDPNAPTLARELKKAGYATGHFGKWHMGGQRDIGNAPPIADYGFDASLTNFEGLGPRVLGIGDAHDGSPPQRIALGSDNLGNGPIEWVDRSQITARYVEGAIDFIDKAEAEGKPFYVNLWPDDVHSPFFPPADKRGDGSKRDRYLGVLETMDAQLGPLFDRIRNDPKLRDNTIILVFSDNGPEGGAGSAGPFRGGKGQLYEGGVRSPLVVWAPGGMPASAKGDVNRDSFFSSIDLVASLHKIAGAPPAAPLDGVALPEVLLGKSSESRGKPLFFRRPPDRNSVDGRKNMPDLAMRDGNWKLLCEYDGSRPELYDLAKDPSESRNLADKEPDRVRSMTAALLEWNRSLPRAKDDPAQ